MHTRTFETSGPVDPVRNYVVPRTGQIADLARRLEKGRCIVIFAPRQTGKTTFFRWALDALDETWLPIQLDFEMYKNIPPDEFYRCLKEDIQKEIENISPNRQVPDDITRFLENQSITSHISMLNFFEQLGNCLKNRRIAVIIDEFDGIPPAAISDFLHTLRRIYLSRNSCHCPYSMGIVGVKSIAQLNYDRSISPFNIQDEFALPNFTLAETGDLLGQYTIETGQAFAPAVIDNLHRQTAGQPFLVNRMAQMLTEEMEIPLEETISNAHFEIAHQRILNEHNTHLSHLANNIRINPRIETVLMEICSYDSGVSFNIRNEAINELTTYGILKADASGFCEIANPIYQYCIVQTFQPLFNGLERKYLSEESEAGFFDYLTPEGKINMRSLLANFRDFIVRAGYRILEARPQEFIGQYLLFAYLDQFVRQVRGFMYVEVRTGRGRMDLIILHKGEKHIVETKIWEGKSRYQKGKRQLAEYLKSEGAKEGAYLVFDHRSKPQAQMDEELIEGKTIVSYCIPIVQKTPSAVR